LRVDDMMADMMADPAAAGMRLSLHDRGPVGGALGRPSDENLFYRSPGFEPTSQRSLFTTGRPRHDQDVVLAGRQWRIAFEAAEPQPNPWLGPLPMLTLFAGLLVSVLLYGILRALASGRSEAVALA